MRDPDYSGSAGCTYAKILRDTFSCTGQRSPTSRVPDADSTGISPSSDADEPNSVDVLANIEQQAIETLRVNTDLREKIESPEGAAWGAIKAFLLEHLPPHLDDRDDLAYRLVKKSMDALYGPQEQNWESSPHPQRKTAYVRRKG